MRKSYINILTLCRIFFGLLFLYFTLIDFNIYFLLLIFILTTFSDYFDGKIAIKYKLNTNEGAKLDVICDFIFIILSTFAVIMRNIIPFWFLFIIIFKLVEFFSISSRNDLYYEKFGHIVALMFYVYPIVALLIHSEMINTFLAIFITVCAVISSISRIRNVIK